MTISVFEDQNSASAKHKCQIIHLHICKIYLILDAGAQVLAAKESSVRRVWGCPVLDIIDFSQPQWTHRRAQLSPSAMDGEPLER